MNKNINGNDDYEYSLTNESRFLEICNASENNQHNQNAQNESINAQKFQNRKNTDHKESGDNIERGNLVVVETSSDSKSRKSSNESNYSGFASTNKDIHFDSVLHRLHTVYKVYLVSGARTCREDDSTKLLSDLISWFIKVFWPKVVVQPFYSGMNIVQCMFFVSLVFV